MPRLTKLFKLKSLHIRKHLSGNYYSAIYEDVIFSEIGLLNTLIVEKIEIQNETHYLFVRWYSGEDTLKELGYV